MTDDPPVTTKDRGWRLSGPIDAQSTPAERLAWGNYASRAAAEAALDALPDGHRLYLEEPS